MKTYVYIDGLNLYYQAVRGTPYKWLDLLTLCRRVFPKNKIEKIKYFTAPVKGYKQRARQEIYLKALKTIPEIEIILGYFRTDSKILPIALYQQKVKKNFETKYRIWTMKTEEKATDVNLAVHLLNDSFKNLFKVAIVLSNDADLTEAIKIVINEHKKPVGILSPYKNMVVQLRKLASFRGRISKTDLENSQFPDQIPGTLIHKLDCW